MKVVAFNGSPRKGGNTELMLKAVLKPIRDAGGEVELIQVGGQLIHGCMACNGCFKNKDQKCVIKTDKVNDYIAKMVEADVIIMGSPTYFSGMTPELKALSDRAGYVAFANDGLFTRKIGSAVAVHRRGGSVSTFDSINHMFLMSKMIIPGSTYWNFGVGLRKGDVSEDAEAMANMKDLGETIAWLAEKMNN